jgi:putative colanic acid biosynthesis acetyltransferase WcaF
VTYDALPWLLPVRGRVPLLLGCYPFLDHSAGPHPASAVQGGPCAVDRFTSDIGGLSPIALCGRTLPSLAFRAASSRLMNIANGVVIKPCVRIKFPWKLQVGAHSWIGEDVWIDNLAPVRIGKNCCISQGAYLCTGSHHYRRVTFDLVTRPIVVADGAWLCAMTRLGPGVTIGEAAVLTIGSVATKDLSPWTIYTGMPAVRTATRNPSVADSTMRSDSE